jgi:hypothetical protein
MQSELLKSTVFRQSINLQNITQSYRTFGLILMGLYKMLIMLIGYLCLIRKMVNSLVTIQEMKSNIFSSKYRNKVK